MHIYVYVHHQLFATTRYVCTSLYYKHGTMYKLEYIDGLVFTNIF